MIAAVCKAAVERQKQIKTHSRGGTWRFRVLAHSQRAGQAVNIVDRLFFHVAERSRLGEINE